MGCTLYSLSSFLWRFPDRSYHLSPSFPLAIPHLFFFGSYNLLYSSVSRNQASFKLMGRRICSNPSFVGADFHVPCFILLVFFSCPLFIPPYFYSFIRLLRESSSTLSCVLPPRSDNVTSPVLSPGNLSIALSAGTSISDLQSSAIVPVYLFKPLFRPRHLFCPVAILPLFRRRLLSNIIVHIILTPANVQHSTFVIASMIYNNPVNVHGW